MNFLFLVIASVLNITYQNIDKQLLKEILGGISGLILIFHFHYKKIITTSSSITIT